MNKLVFLTVLSCLFFFNCKTTKHIEQSNIIIELEKTYCSGPCPVYTLQIASTGNVILEGKENLTKIGRFKSKLSQEQLDALINEFDEIDFFTLNDSYTSFMMDLPTNYITYSKNGQTKKIKAYDNVPKQLINLINNIDKLVKELDWTKL